MSTTTVSFLVQLTATAAPSGRLVPSPEQPQILKLSLLPDSMQKTPVAEAGKVPRAHTV